MAPLDDDLDPANITEPPYAGLAAETMAREMRDKITVAQQVGVSGYATVAIARLERWATALETMARLPELSA